MTNSNACLLHVGGARGETAALCRTIKGSWRTAATAFGAALAASCLMMVCGLPGLAGCAKTYPRAIMFTGPTRGTVVADWNDIDAAVDVACGKCEMARVRAVESASDGWERREIEIITAGDEPVLLTAKRHARARVDDERNMPPERIELEVLVGRFGDAAKERQFMGWVTRRLEQLAGVDVAPIR